MPKFSFVMETHPAVTNEIKRLLNSVMKYILRWAVLFV